MRNLFPTIARVLLGLIFFVFGLNGLLGFLPAPDDVPAGAAAFGSALAQTGYMMPLIAITQIVAGALLIANRFVPLALALIAPVIVNIVAFHAFLAPASSVPAIVVVALELYLVW